jgi:ribosomal protein S18 acetylase RimI-like enzyme
MPHETIFFRDIVNTTDVMAVREIVVSTGFFSDEEICVATDIVEERLAKNEKSGYNFIFLESSNGSSNKVMGYVCYGRIPGCSLSYDIYWIAVHNDYRNRGIGKKLLMKAEEEIKKLGGNRIYLDTSSRKQYEPTHKFYEKCGYARKVFLEDFYSSGDGKIIYLKLLDANISQNMSSQASETGIEKVPLRSLT